ncbi:TonB-dependent receptor [Methylocystis sp. 9N]|uniref:TonB-dependent receptor n=1 Tax=Methylocystis borbori TaxID=3118750 RepID=A0ABU7XD29_9HYPH
MSRSALLRGASAASLLLALIPSFAIAQQTLPTIDIGARLRTGPAVRTAPSQSGAATPAVGEASAGETGYAPGFNAARAKLPIYRDPPGQTVTTVKTNFLRSTPMATVQEMLRYSPGVSFSQGLTPRDLIVSIRGSGNRLSNGVRNIQMFDDGFPLVTSDGNTRTDMIDPHAYSAVDVYRGPSSALFGNHALFGAINFRTRDGAEIDGVQTGSEFGSFGYINNYVTFGKRSGAFDFSAFASDLRGDGHIIHNAYNYQTVNFRGTWAPTETDRVTLKYIYNNTFAQISQALPILRYYLNPFQFGCEFAIANNPYCASIQQPRNGISGTLTSQSFSQLGAHQHLNRHIAGLRWEHDFDNDTILRNQVTYNYLDYINGTVIPPRFSFGGPVQVRGPSVGLNVTSDITNHGTLFGLPATHFLGFFYDNTKTTNPAFVQVPNVWDWGMPGGAAGKIDSYHSNIGLRAREEIAFAEGLTGVIGFSSNWNRTWGVNSVYTYNAASALTLPYQVALNRAFWNTAPEASLTYRYNPEWQFRARYAAGYGTPNFTTLTTNSQGTSATANTSLKPQTNMGVDVGVDWTPSPDLTMSLTGFHEWYRNEILSLTTGAPLLVNYSLNIPAAIHRGVEFNADWRPVEGVSLIAVYSFNNQFITNMMEGLPSGGSPLVYLNRSGKKLPNVPPHTATARAGYDVPHGDFKGVGAFVEYVFKSQYTLDASNLSSVPGYGLVNANVHYNRDVENFYFRNIELYLSVNNIFDRRYMASTFILPNTLTAGIETPAAILFNTGGGVYAGQPRAVIGGVKLKF